MKNIYLIGDSIRYGSTGGAGSPGYSVFVKEKLQGKAEVFAPDENCRFAQYTLRQICEWASAVDAKKIDVVHFNAGLWDVLRLDGDEPLTPIDVYVYMLERVCTKLRLFFPNAKLIFATSTAVIEEAASKDFFRCNREIEEYNDAAKKLMDKLGIPVNDLYPISAKFDRSYHADWVHPNVAGARILADAVINSIEKHTGNLT